VQTTSTPMKMLEVGNRCVVWCGVVFFVRL